MTENIDQIQLIVCDIDNTLLPAGQDRLSKVTIDAIEKVVSSGRKFFICSGRHYKFLPKSFFEDVPMDLIGTINGACLVNRDGDVIEKHPMTQKDMEEITRICQENDIGLGFKFEDTIVTYANHDKFVNGYIKNEAERAMVLNCDDTKDHHLEHGLPLGIFLIGDEKVIDAFKDYSDNLVFAWSYRDGYDVFTKGITKSIAIERVLKEYGLGWENVIGFGDAGNDTDFIRKSGIGVALGNAKDDVKKYADLVAEDCDQDGVAKMLKKLHII